MLAAANDLDLTDIIARLEMWFRQAGVPVAPSIGVQTSRGNHQAWRMAESRRANPRTSGSGTAWAWWPLPSISPPKSS